MGLARDIDEEIVDWVRNQRKKHGISQSKLAEYLFISEDGLSKRMHGKQHWTLVDVYMIAHVFGVQPHAIIPKIDKGRLWR